MAVSLAVDAGVADVSSSPIKAAALASGLNGTSVPMVAQSPMNAVSFGDFGVVSIYIPFCV